MKIMKEITGKSKLKKSNRFPKSANVSKIFKTSTLQEHKR